jgi:hypothetical protein
VQVADHRNLLDHVEFELGEPTSALSRRAFDKVLLDFVTLVPKLPLS